MASRPKSQLVPCSLLLICCAIGVPESRADSLFFSETHYVISSAPERLDLFSNPGAVLEPQTYGGTTYPPRLIFGTLVPFAGGESLSDTIRWTYQEEGAAPIVNSQTFTTGPDPITLGFVTSFSELRQAGRPIPATLTVDLLSSAPDFRIPGGPGAGTLVDSFTYSFFTLTPVPEPSTLTLLLVSGGLAAASRARRRRSRG